MPAATGNILWLNRIRAAIRSAEQNYRHSREVISRCKGKLLRVKRIMATNTSVWSRPMPLTGHCVVGSKLVFLSNIRCSIPCLFKTAGDREDYLSKRHSRKKRERFPVSFFRLALPGSLEALRRFWTRRQSRYCRFALSGCINRKSSVMFDIRNVEHNGARRMWLARQAASGYRA